MRVPVCSGQFKRDLKAARKRGKDITRRRGRTTPTICFSLVNAPYMPVISS